MTDEQILKIAREACRPFPWATGPTSGIFLDAVRAVLASSSWQASPAASSAENRPAQGDVRDAQRFRHIYEGGRYVVCELKGDEIVNIGGSYVMREAIDAAIASQSEKEPK